MTLLEEIDWLLIGELIYGLIVAATCVRIIYDTRTSTKTLAYLLLTVFLPVVGMILYFSVGLNYRTRSLYSKKLFDDDQLLKKLYAQITRVTRNTLKPNQTSNPAPETISFPHLFIRGN